MIASYTFPADSFAHAREIADRLSSLFATADDTVQTGCFTDVPGFAARITTTDPVRLHADLESEGFFE